MALEITVSNIDELLATPNKLVVIDFWAEWCGPCKTIAPIVAELADTYEGKVIIGKCDVDDNGDIAVKYAIRNIPTLLFVKDNQVVERIVGAVPKSQIIDKIEQYL